MEITIIGIRHSEFDAKDGNHVCGRTIFYSYSDSRTEGTACDKVFLSDRKFPQELSVGEVVRLMYNRFGKVEYIMTV